MKTESKLIKRTYNVDVLGGILSVRWAAASVWPGLAPEESSSGGIQGFLKLKLRRDAGIASQNSHVVKSFVLNRGTFSHQVTTVVVVVRALLTNPNDVLEFKLFSF